MIDLRLYSEMDLAGLRSGMDQTLEEVLFDTQKIIDHVRSEKDEALREYTLKFDGIDLSEKGLKVQSEDIQQAYEQVIPEFIYSLETAISNIEQFHERQKKHSWLDYDGRNNMWGQLVRPIKRVGVYVPGGTAAYPSSVLMNCIPAKVAGVQEIVMTAPPDKNGDLSPYTLVAADMLGIKEIYRVGGAHAVAALAFGTETIKPVLKITGPGNIFVTAAKKLVYGVVDIDMLAGPSEILIIADGKADPEYLAADMLSQAEHDFNAASVLVTPDKSLAEKVQGELEKQLPKLSREKMARTSIEENGLIVITDDLLEAVKAANEFAPEHLEIMTEQPFDLLDKIENAGAVFVGSYTPEPVGDYFGGTNHILPTGGTAKYASPVGVETFLKETDVLSYSKKGLLSAAAKIETLAAVEGLDAHEKAVSIRRKGINDERGETGKSDPGN